MSQAVSLRESQVTTWSVFRSILARDIYVTGRELPAFLAQVILQPLFLLFVFGKILTSHGYASQGYKELLFPGIMALTVVITSVQAIAFPLVAEFGWTREIEDRLLAPISTTLVAVEKLLFASLRAITATLMIIPIGWIVLGSIPWRWSALPLLVVIVVLGSFAGAAIGLMLGTFVQPQRINIVFSLVFTPLLFTGASQYPWPSLSSLRWFQVVTACNPMTYVSEGLRAALVPRFPHIEGWICVVVLIVALCLLIPLGLYGFRRRAIN
jgi:ABC-2 type transport system permease protein